MEEQLETILENITDYDSFNETDYHYEYSLHTIIHEVCIFTIAIISLIADIIIVYIVARNKRMQTKRNLMIMNIALTEALFMYNTPSFFTRLLNLFDVYPPAFVDCVLTSTEFSYLVGLFLLLFVVCISKIMESQKIKLIWILGTVYGIVITIVLIDAALCMEEPYSVDWPITLLISFTMLLLTVIIKDCCYYCKGKILDSEFRLSYNLARITTYNWLICMLTMIMIDEISTILPFHLEYIFEYIWISVFANGIYLLVYLIRSDADYKICFYNLFKKADNEATVSFADDFTNPVDEIETVNININNVNGVGVVKI